MDFEKFINEQLAQLESQHQLRQLSEVADSSGMLNLSSNDYLGLSQDMKLYEEFYNELPYDKYNLSASSSRLLTGNHKYYTEAENLLSGMYGGRAALIFNSGYHANIGILPALSSKADLILGDKLNHASIIDGCQLAQADFKRYNHLDYVHLENMLKNRNEYQHAFIVTESVFSMDGDIADLEKLVEIKEKYNCILIVDEAHAIGVFGDKGCGLCEDLGLINDIDIIIATFGKAICSSGACVITSEPVKQFLVNKMRSLIFTTALPPVVLSWTSFILEKVIAMNDRRRYLINISNILRKGLEQKGFATAGKSQIVPLILGENEKALDMADKLRQANFQVFAIRPPTVPQGTARLRFSLNAALAETDIEKILISL
ncbi:MAG: 8-amino-7-oxononanoate synthase [Phycisphaerae bacterium]|nr:8-amino-7-oxononanoate synthase [Phycisphaerae bacterium]